MMPMIAITTSSSTSVKAFRLIGTGMTHPESLLKIQKINASLYPGIEGSVNQTRMIERHSRVGSGVAIRDTGRFAAILSFRNGRLPDEVRLFGASDQLEVRQTTLVIRWPSLVRRFRCRGKPGRKLRDCLQACRRTRGGQTDYDFGKTGSL